VTDWIEVAPSRELMDRKPIRVSMNDEAVLLIKVDDHVFAIGNQCSHQGAGLDRGVVKVAGSLKTVTCPAHGSMFDLETGKVMRPPATKSVQAYEVKVEDGHMFLRLRDQ
jgi:3-phenylpropionate/trans-cinnamate dioxygenase ferredoxin component